MSKHKQIEAGTVFGRLTVARYAGHTLYECRCECGKTTTVFGRDLRSGNTTSCGCYRLERIREGNARKRIIPDSPQDPVVAVWRGIIHRCTNPKSPAYPRYGGRGIKVCKRWRESVWAFLEDMGPRPTPAHTVERIDGARGYEPGNCRWATRKEQARNRPERNVRLTCQGRTMLMVEWAEETGIPLGTLHARLKRGWPEERAILTPVRRAKRKGTR